MQYFNILPWKTTAFFGTLITVLGGIVLAKLILAEQYRYIFIVFVIPTLALTFRKYWNRKDLVKIVIITSFFSIPVNISTTNLGSTSQYIIIGVFFLFIVGYLIGWVKVVFTKNIFLMISLLFANGAISTFSTLGNHDIFRTSFWSLIMLITCGFFLLIIDSIDFINKEEKEKYFTQLMDLIIFLTCVQVIIGAIVYYVPDAGTYLSIFYSENNEQFLVTTITVKNIARLRTIVLTVESLGEFVSVLMPYILYRLTAKKFSPVYIVYMLILCSGLMLSATRSGMILTCFSIVVYLVFIETSLKKKISLIFSTVVVLLIIFYFNVGVSTSSERFLMAYDNYMAGGTVLDVANRSFFKDNLGFLFDTISLFGNGLVSPLMYGILYIDFHNLFMTILFRYGVVGFIIYFSFPAILIKQTFAQYKLFSTEKIYKVILLSIFIFFVNECQFEYTRQLSGVLIIWQLFSVYFLLVKNMPPRYVVSDSETV